MGVVKIYGPSNQHSVVVNHKNGEVCEHYFEREEVGDSLGRVLPVSTCTKCMEHLKYFHGWSNKPVSVKFNSDEDLEYEELRRDSGIMQDRMARAFSASVLDTAAEQRKREKAEAKKR